MGCRQNENGGPPNSLEGEEVNINDLGRRSSWWGGGRKDSEPACCATSPSLHVQRRLPRFTFSPFTRDPNLQQTKFTRDPNLHISKFTQDPNLHETKFTHDPNLHENLHKTRFTQTQIYTKPIFTRSQIYTNPNLHINRNSKEGQTYDIFLKSPWYEDLKNNSPECLACKYTNTASSKIPYLNMIALGEQL